MPAGVPTLTTDLARTAWELSYLDAPASGRLGRDLAAAGHADGWLLVALAELRGGDVAQGRQALGLARAASLRQADAARLALCDEVQAIALRRQGDIAGCRRLQDAVDARGVAGDAMHRFIAHNSRAVTAKALRDADRALRHFYAARGAALDTGWAGPRITVLANLGSYHVELFNLDDACTLTEQALADARACGARHAEITAMVNLVVIHHAMGELPRAHALALQLEQPGPGGAPAAGLRPEYAPYVALGHLSAGDAAAARRCLQRVAGTAPLPADLPLLAWLQACCLLAEGDAGGARQVALQELQRRRDQGLPDAGYDYVSLQQALAQACEEAGDAAAAPGPLRAAFAAYQRLMVSGARARQLVLQVEHDLQQARSESARLAELNAALQRQVQANEALQAQLREQALRDPLTGLHNRRFLFEAAQGLIEAARRDGQPLAVAVCDIDHFKRLNDEHGHAVGDAVLQRFAELMRHTLRKADVLCRHGGEEFVALLPGTDAAGAQALLQRLLHVLQQPAAGSDGRPLPASSFSAGVARLGDDCSTLAQLLSAADAALYAAKHRGRARIELAVA